MFMSLHKISKLYQRWRLNPLSSLFHQGLIRILVFSHLSRTGDTWEDFLCRNNFTLPEKTVESALLFNKNSSPCKPTTKKQGVDPHKYHATIELNFVAIQNPLGKNPRYDFMPRKLLEEVIDVLKDRVSSALIVESTQGVLNKLIVKKNCKHKGQSNSDLSFVNKRPGRLISRNLRNCQQDNLSSIPAIKVDDHLSDDEINEFISREDVDDQFLGNETGMEAIQYDFVSEIPLFLKN
jgi:hypothetical protein